jgi:hypothetical protein
LVLPRYYGNESKLHITGTARLNTIKSPQVDFLSSVKDKNQEHVANPKVMSQLRPVQSSLDDNGHRELRSFAHVRDTWTQKNGVDSASAYLSRRKADKSFVRRKHATMTIEIDESTK